MFKVLSEWQLYVFFVIVGIHSFILSPTIGFGDERAFSLRGGFILIVDLAIVLIAYLVARSVAVNKKK